MANSLIKLPKGIVKTRLLELIPEIIAEHSLTALVSPRGYGKKLLASHSLQILAESGVEGCWINLDSNQSTKTALLVAIASSLIKVHPFLGKRIEELAAFDIIPWKILYDILCDEIKLLNKEIFIVLNGFEQVQSNEELTCLEYLLSNTNNLLSFLILSRKKIDIQFHSKLSSVSRVLDKRELSFSFPDAQRLLKQRQKSPVIDNETLVECLDIVEGRPELIWPYYDAKTRQLPIEELGRECFSSFLDSLTDAEKEQMITLSKVGFYCEDMLNHIGFENSITKKLEDYMHVSIKFDKKGRKWVRVETLLQQQFALTLLSWEPAITKALLTKINLWFKNESYSQFKLLWILKYDAPNDFIEYLNQHVSDIIIDFDIDWLHSSITDQAAHIDITDVNILIKLVWILSISGKNQEAYKLHSLISLDQVGRDVYEEYQIQCLYLNSLKDPSAVNSDLSKAIANQDNQLKLGWATLCINLAISFANIITANFSKAREAISRLQGSFVSIHELDSIMEGYCLIHQGEINRAIKLLETKLPLAEAQYGYFHNISIYFSTLLYHCYIIKEQFHKSEFVIDGRRERISKLSPLIGYPLMLKLSDCTKSICQGDLNDALEKLRQLKEQAAMDTVFYVPLCFYLEALFNIMVISLSKGDKSTAQNTLTHLNELSKKGFSQSQLKVVEDYTLLANMCLEIYLGNYIEVLSYEHRINLGNFGHTLFENRLKCLFLVTYIRSQKNTKASQIIENIAYSVESFGNKSILSFLNLFVSIKEHPEVQQLRPLYEKKELVYNDRVKNFVDNLSVRENEIYKRMCEGNTNKEIARSLNVSPDTIKWHIKNIFQKLNVKNRSEAIKKGVDAGVFSK